MGSSQFGSGDFARQLEGFGLTTIQIHYYMPDHPSLLQMFAFQQEDLAPRFPRLERFLDHWRREIEATLHSIRIAHKHLIGPQEWRAVDGVITIN
ncbi:usg protein [Novosphingobium olei]|uniref:usg protein n=1 Tax=Novosphingobium olei TaxID=2728851 RepID=UPI0030860229|nr:usg protein [Novosphingobium olei]